MDNTYDNPITFVCKLCNQDYQHKDGPLMLPCLHSFCKPCLAQYIKKGNFVNHAMACPTCDTCFPIPNDISKFPINFRLSHIAKYRAYEKQAAGGNVKCEKCVGTPRAATTFCCNRGKFLCSICKSDYQRLLDDEDLNFIEIASFDQGGKIYPPPECPKHTKQNLTLFCEDCKELICLHCSQTEHQIHEKSSLSVASEKQKAELQQKLSCIDSALGTMDETLKRVRMMKDEVKVSAEKASNRINEACDDLIQEVNNRREVLQRRCREIANGKDSVLSDQAIEIHRIRQKLAFAQLHSEDAINNQSHEEILSVTKAIQLQLNHTMEMYQKQSMELREDATITISVEKKALLNVIRTFGFFPGVPDPSNCHIEGLAVPVAGVGKDRKMVVALADETTEPIRGTPHLQCKLRKIDVGPDGYIPPIVKIEKSNNTSTGQAILKFTPDQPGEYEVAIMVRNRPIGKAYITARQPRDYTNFHNLQSTIKSVEGACYGVAVHQNGTVYATNYSYNIVKVFRPDGTESKIGGSDTAGGKLYGPCGIALLNNMIYVVSYGTHMVKMYSTDGRLIGGFGGYGTETGKFYYPYGICTDGKERLFVADCSNKRIQVFTSQGRFVKSFQCSSSPYDIALDTVGNIHVALKDNNHIAVYSLHGRHVETYNLGGKLCGPTGIYIDGEDNRLIGAYGNGQVHIADPTNSLISTRQLHRAWGVTMDKNGTIYVAEARNGHISTYNI